MYKVHHAHWKLYLIRFLHLKLQKNAFHNFKDGNHIECGSLMTLCETTPPGPLEVCGLADPDKVHGGRTQEKISRKQISNHSNEARKVFTKIPLSRHGWKLRSHPINIPWSYSNKERLSFLGDVRNIKICQVLILGLVLQIVKAPRFAAGRQPTPRRNPFKFVP